MLGAGPGPRPRSGGGFTIAELVVVIGLVGLLAAISAPRFFGRSEFDQSLFREEMAAALRYAQKVAVATGCPVQVSLGSGSYALTRRSGCDTGSFDQPVGAPEAPQQAYSGAAPSGVELSSSVDPFVFDALGRARTSGGSVTDVDVGIGSASLRVVGETGFVDAG